MKNYFFFIIYLILRPKLLVLFLKGIYLPVYIQYEWIKKYNIGTFIDVGALDGNVSNVINHIFPHADIFAFEPIKEKLSKIRSKITSDRLILETLAITDREGEAYFYEYDYKGASSFLRPEPKNRKIFGKHIAKKYPVQTTALDNYFRNRKLTKPIVLKIDTQGTEELVLNGGKNLLKKIYLIIVETSFVNFYQKQCKFEDIYNYLAKLGFVYKGKVLDSDFYPFFGLAMEENSVFIKNTIS